MPHTHLSGYCNQEKKRLHWKQQPPKYHLKGTTVDQDDDEEEEDTTKTISLREVYQKFEKWIPGMKGELNQRVTKLNLLLAKIYMQMTEAKQVMQVVWSAA